MIFRIIGREVGAWLVANRAKRMFKRVMKQPGIIPKLRKVLVQEGFDLVDEQIKDGRKVQVYQRGQSKFTITETERKKPDG